MSISSKYRKHTLTELRQVDEFSFVIVDFTIPLLVTRGPVRQLIREDTEELSGTPSHLDLIGLEPYT